MIISRQSLRDGAVWIALGVLTLAGVWGAYPAAAHRIGGASGGSVYGITTGIIGTGMIVLAMALIVRKTWRTLRVGRTYGWLQGHVWLGLVSYPIICFHAGWRWGGPLTTWLMISFSIVWVTGIIGLVIQNLVPRVMFDRLPKETVYGQIGQVGLKNIEAARQIVENWVERNEASAVMSNRASAGEELRRFHKEQVQPFLLYGSGAGPRSFLDPRAAPMLPAELMKEASSSRVPGAEAFAGIRNRFTTLFEPLCELEAIVMEHQQHLLQRKLHWLMHGWLLVHVPVSVVMFVMIPVHGALALRY
jgi:hypothetical protein